MIYDQNRFRNRTPSPLKNVHFLAKSSTVDHHYNYCTKYYALALSMSEGLNFEDLAKAGAKGKNDADAELHIKIQHEAWAALNSWVRMYIHH